MPNLRLIDSHCHLNYPELHDNLDAVVARAKEAGVKRLLTISTKLDQTHNLLKITETYPEIYATVGVHPHDVEEEGVPSCSDLMTRTKNPKIVGIGETGLDYYYEHTDRIKQQQSFIAHIQAAAQLDLPLIIHSRAAEEDIVGILQDEKVSARNRPGVIHCFSGTRSFAHTALEMGFYISISGIVTFKNANMLRDIVCDLPLEKMLIETDAPYLAPVPHRGKPNEPAFVVHTAQALASLKGVSLEEVGMHTTNNFFTLFQKATV